MTTNNFACTQQIPSDSAKSNLALGECKPSKTPILLNTHDEAKIGTHPRSINFYIAAVATAQLSKCKIVRDNFHEEHKLRDGSFVSLPQQCWPYPPLEGAHLPSRLSDATPRSRDALVISTAIVSRELEIFCHALADHDEHANACVLFDEKRARIFLMNIH